MKDWQGNSVSVFSGLGATNHSKSQRQSEDYYATSPKAVKLLLELENFNENILEPCCGEGHISKTLEAAGYSVKSMDLIDRGYGESGINFLEYWKPWNGDIITNPPYKYAQEFVEHSLGIIPEGRRVAMFLKIQFLEGKSRREMFNKNPPKYVYVSSSRLGCAKNGKFVTEDDGGAVCYCWFIWEKGFKGEPIIRWFN